MLKLLEFPGEDAGGNALVSAFTPGDSRVLEKVASAGLDPRMEAFLSGLRPDPKKLYVLVNAMGAGEYYGANRNGDYFEEAQLRPDPSESDGEHGYTTFLKAGIYRHHRNKDISQSAGEVIYALYNELMHRVELVLCLDRDKAMSMGYEQVVADLDAGKHPAVSMGCRVKYDVCSICGHKSPTRGDYCEHTRLSMGKLLPDGRKVFVYNPKPRFFDISFVAIPADMTGFAMLKVASLRSRMSADLAEEHGLVEPPAAHTWTNKLAQQRKISNIVKAVPAMSARVIRPITDSEPQLPRSILSAMAGMPLDRALTTSGAAGVVLSPAEYQHIVLTRMGRPQLADSLMSAGCHFSPVDSVDRSVRLGVGSGVSEMLLRALSPILEGRSAFSPQLTRRVCIIKIGSSGAAPQYQLLNNDRLLDLVAAGYNGYREQLLEKAGSLVANVTTRDVRLLESLGAANVGDMFVDEQNTKTAASPTAAVALLGAIPLAYLYGARASGKPGTGDTGPMERFLEKHPVIAASVFVGLTRLGATLQQRGLLNKRLLNQL